jgi:hypothetical protein
LPGKVAFVPLAHPVWGTGIIEPNDIEWTGKVIQDICFNNAKSYFNWNEVIK